MIIKENKLPFMILNPPKKIAEETWVLLQKHAFSYSAETRISYRNISCRKHAFCYRNMSLLQEYVVFGGAHGGEGFRTQESRTLDNFHKNRFKNYHRIN